MAKHNCGPRGSIQLRRAKLEMRNMPKPKPETPFIVRRDGRVALSMRRNDADGTVYAASQIGGVQLTQAEVRRLAKWLEDTR